MISGIVARLAASRLYYLIWALSALFVSLMLARRETGKTFGSFTQFCILSLLGSDAVLRWLAFGAPNMLGLIDFVLTGLCANVYVFNMSFSWIASVNLVPLLSVAFAIRCVVSAQQYVTLRESVKPVPRRFCVEETSAGQKRKKFLDICYVTSRIISVSKGSLVNEEHEFLESKYSNFLKSLPSLPTGEVASLGTVATIVESAVVHLFSNPVNVVSVNTPMGDSNSMLLICALLLRTGAARSAQAAVDMYLSQRFLVYPDAQKLFPATLMSQLKIFETIMIRSASREFMSALVSDSRFSVKRVVISQLDASQFLDLRLAVVEVESGRVFSHNITPSSSGSSLTYICNVNVSEDTLFVLTDSQDRPVAKFYMHAKFHLVKNIASQSSYHFVVHEVDRWSSRLESARIEVWAAVSDPDSPRDSKPSLPHIDKDLLSLPPAVSTRDSSCLIV